VAPPTVIGTWITIPAGTFKMGSPTSEPCRIANEDSHLVTLTQGFELMATEVTQGEYEKAMGHNPSFFKNCGSDCPVEQVNWHMAVAYCNTLSQQKGLLPCYSCTGSGSSISCQEASGYSGKYIYKCPGYRLPTEAEWEWAYRAGTQKAYYNGDNMASACSGCAIKDVTLDAIGWSASNAAVVYAQCTDLSSWGCPSCAGTHPVGKKQGNPWGLFDMAGNVSEWCHDWFLDNLGTSSVSDPGGPGKGSSRVCRGGSWYLSAAFLRAATRYDSAPKDQSQTIGFRCGRRITP
jgi:formylglycine-generating enzyme required for sulfatase activity